MMRQACLCLNPPADLPRHGATAALVRLVDLNRAANRAHHAATMRLARGARTIPARLRVGALDSARKRARRVYLARIARLGVVS